MSEDKKPFTVNDRRHFTPSGETREESVEQAPTPPAAGAAVSSPEAAPPPNEATLVGFLLGLASQAAAVLQSASEEAASAEERGARLAEARHIISILEMMKDKTQGRRTAEEEQVLEGVLYELRMAYLHSTTAAGPA